MASEHAGDNRKNLLLASSVSVATIKLPNIVKDLSHYNDLSIRIVLTKAAENFLAGQSGSRLYLGLSTVLRMLTIYAVMRMSGRSHRFGVVVFFTLSCDAGQIFS